MFNSFKNTELFRHYIRYDLSKNTEKLINQNKSNFSLIAGSIFSGSFSILGSYLSLVGTVDSKTTSGNMGLLEIVVYTVIFCVLFVLGMSIFKGAICLGTRIKQFIKNSTKKEKLISEENAKALIEEFDHRACDNILIAQNFIDAYEKEEKNDKLKIFYFYEVIYYTKNSLGIINRIFVSKNSCISMRMCANKIQLYRIENVLEMLAEINHFIQEENNKIVGKSVMGGSVEKEVEDIMSELSALNTNFLKIKDDYYNC